MEFSLNLHAINSGWSIVYIEGSQVTISQKSSISLSKYHFVLANSAGPDKMMHYVAFHLGPHFLPKYTLRGFRSTKCKYVNYVQNCVLPALYLNRNDPLIEKGIAYIA